MFPTIIAVNIGLATGVTVGIVLVLVGLFLAHRTLIEKKKDDIRQSFVMTSYVFLIALMVVGIVIILNLWGYDATDMLGALFQDTTLFLEENMPRFIGVLVTLVVALAVYKMIKIALYRVGRKESPNQRRKKTIAKIALSVSKYFIVIITTLVILAIVGVNIGPALAGLGIIGLVIGLGAQKFINDLISGLFIIFEHHFDVGDWVQIQGFSGEVTDIGLKTTKVKSFTGEVRIFNNGSVSPVSNFNMADSLAIVNFSIAYKENIAEAIEVLREELPKLREENEYLLEEPRVLGVTELADSGVNLRVVVKTVPMTQWGVERLIRQRVKEILDANGIEIPFPQVVVHKPKMSE